MSQKSCAGGGPLRDATILLVDDEVCIRLLVRTAIEPLECNILEAGTAEAAIECIQEQWPDLIVLDWMLPGMDGIDLLETMQRVGVAERIPVVLLTAKGRQVDRDRAYRAGVAVFVQKPFDPSKLLETIRGLLAASTREAK
jgi:two-component system phosphate regulon response regulator PhoB